MTDSATEIEKKIKKAVTDTDDDVRFDWEKKPGVTNLLEIYSQLHGESPQAIAERYTRYGDLKNDLVGARRRSARADSRALRRTDGRTRRPTRRGVARRGQGERGGRRGLPTRGERDRPHLISPIHQFSRSPNAFEPK